MTLLESFWNFFFLETFIEHVCGKTHVRHGRHRANYDTYVSSGLDEGQWVSQKLCSLVKVYTGSYWSSGKNLLGWGRRVWWKESTRIQTILTPAFGEEAFD